MAKKDGDQSDEENNVDIDILSKTIQTEDEKESSIVEKIQKDSLMERGSLKEVIKDVKQGGFDNLMLTESAQLKQETNQKQNASK